MGEIMKRSILILFVIAVFIGSSNPALACRFDKRYTVLQNKDIDIVHGSIVITDASNQYRDIVRISENYNLYVNGQKIRTNRRQACHLKQYHHYVCEIHRQATLMGGEALQIGVLGTRSSALAFSKFRRASFTKDTDPELRNAISGDYLPIEEHGADLEDWGDQVKIMIENLKVLHIKLNDEIPALRKLQWF